MADISPARRSAMADSRGRRPLPPGTDRVSIAGSQGLSEQDVIAELCGDQVSFEGSAETQGRLIAEAIVAAVYGSHRSYE